MILVFEVGKTLHISHREKCTHKLTQRFGGLQSGTEVFFFRSIHALTQCHTRTYIYVWRSTNHTMIVHVQVHCTYHRHSECCCKAKCNIHWSPWGRAQSFQTLLKATRVASCLLGNTCCYAAAVHSGNTTTTTE